MFSRTPGLSIAGFSTLPASPPVQLTTITSAPSATYLAIVAAPLLDSSSGCACTAIRRSVSRDSARERDPVARAPSVVTLGAGVVIAWGAYANLGPAPMSADRVSYAEQPGNTMSITINVTRDDSSRPGVCIVRTRDFSGAESGRKEIYVPPGQGVLTTVI